MSKSIRIQKTDFSIPVIDIVDYDISKIRKELKKFMPELTEDLRSIPCVISISDEGIGPTFLAQLLEIFRQFDFLPVGIKTDNEYVMEQANYSGLAVFDDAMKESSKVISQKNQESFVTARIQTHHQTIYSGEQVYAEGGDLIVLGDVEPGAEVIADGNIYIGGSLLGKAYAGNSGLMNIDKVSVRAYVFEPELVCVAGFYQLHEDMPKKYMGLPVKVCFKNQKLEYFLEK